MNLMYKFLIPLFALALLIGCTPSEPVTDDITSATTTTMEDGYRSALLTGKHEVTLKTSMGDIVLELDADEAPKAATNFFILADTGYYNGLTFHRVIPDFMIQGGDPNGNGTGGSSIFNGDFEDEPNNLPMVRGALAMANRGPNTNGSQFFIVQVESADWLQGKHTVFGRVTDGMDVVDAIANTPANPSNNMPLTPVTYTTEIEAAPELE